MKYVCEYKYVNIIYTKCLMKLNQKLYINVFLVHFVISVPTNSVILN